MQPHWQYFLAIETDLNNTTRYVEPVQSNFDTYSIEFAKILLAACSEVDVVAKQLWNASGKTNIGQHRAEVTKLYPKLPSIEITVPRYGMTLKPWIEWSATPNGKGGPHPPWWGKHTDVKHNRAHHFPAANLGNTISAVAALMALNLYLHQPEFMACELQGWPVLLDYSRNFDRLVSGNASLPDFP